MAEWMQVDYDPFGVGAPATSGALPPFAPAPAPLAAVAGPSVGPYESRSPWKDYLGGLISGGATEKPSQAREFLAKGLVGSSGLGVTQPSVVDFTPAAPLFAGNEMQHAGSTAEAAVASAAAIPAARGAMQGARTLVMPKAAPLAPAAPAGAVTDLAGALKPAQAPVRGQTGQEILAMQQAALSEPEQALLYDLGRQYPQFGAASRYMLPGELRTLLNPDAAQQTQRLLEVLPPASEMASLAKAGAAKQGWYRGSTQALIDIFGETDAPRFATLLAATSPQTSVESNLINSLNIWKNWTAAGRPTDEKAIKAVMGKSVQGNKGEDSILPAWINNTVRALAAPDPTKVTISGPKVDSFFRNLADDVYRVTNDAWMANATGIDQNILRLSPSDKQLLGGNPGFSPAYGALSARVREGAESVNMLPSEGQETIWSYVMPLMEGQRTHGVPARELLQRGMITDDVIRGTPDFSTLLGSSKAYSDPLIAAGYGDELARMKPYGFSRIRPALTPSDQANVERTAERLESLRETRGRESRAFVPGAAFPERAFAYATPEYVPHPSTGIAPSIAEGSFKSQENFTSRIGAAFKDQQGHDVLHRGLGLDTIETRPMTGVYQSDIPGAAPSITPGQAAGVEVPLKKTRQGLTVDPYAQNQLSAAAALRGGMTGQRGSAWNAQLVDEAGSSLMIPRDKKLTPLEAAAVLGHVPGDRGAIADTGGGVNILNWGERFTNDEAAALAKAASGSDKFVRSNNVSGYIDLGPKWDEGVGSRAVTNEMTAHLDKLKRADLKGLDSQGLRYATQDILDIYQTRMRQGEQVRPDFINMLQILAKSGIAGLKKAMKDPSQLLPALVALGLGPTLLESASSSEASQQRP